MKAPVQAAADAPTGITSTRKLRLETIGLSTLLGFVLVGCGGDEGGAPGGGVGLGSGQTEDPVVIDFPIAYIKRTLPVDDEGEAIAFDARELTDFAAGAELILRDRASPTALEKSITRRLFEDPDAQTPGADANGPAPTPQPVDIRDLEASYDGTRLLFALRMPVDPDGEEDEQPTWNIWEYDIPNDSLYRVISSDITAEQGHDVSPHYLSDGRIIFSSTRQRRSSALLLDENKPQFQAIDEDGNEPAFVLHTMTGDGTDIQQVTYNQSHDQDPLVLQSGHVVFSRWDNNRNDGIHLYKMRPDGSGLQLLYGAESHFTGTNGSEIQFLEPREMPDGRLLVMTRPFTPANFGGDITFIDVDNFVENDQPLAKSAGMPGPAQRPATINVVDTDQDPSPGGRYSSVFPLWDGTDRLLVTWTQCRLQRQDSPTAVIRIGPCTEGALSDPTWEPAPPLYGVWLYDLASDTQLPILEPEEGIWYAEAVAAQPRTAPAVLLPGAGPVGTFDPALADAGVGVIHIRSIYDFDGESIVNMDFVSNPARSTADQRPRRFVRLTKPVSQPDDDVFEVPDTAFGPNRSLGMREILGYAPVEPDGSVKVMVPANVAFSLSVLNREGRRIGASHRTWLSVQAGEILECNGCHEPSSPVSHGRPGSFEPVNQGAQTTSLPFPNTTPEIFADFGETMAEARTRISCAIDDCTALRPTLDIVYEDVWTDQDTAGRPPDASFAFRYEDIRAAFDDAQVDQQDQSPVWVPPTSEACLQEWSPTCRITINYEEHIHPLWSRPRLVLDQVNLTVIQDNTCVTCHSPVGADGLPQLPAAQLDLGDGPSVEQPERFKAYRELLFADTEQALVNGVLVDAQFEQGTDPDTGLPILVTRTVPRVAEPFSANQSTRFIEPFSEGGVHEGYLSDAELRLISEWLDIGAQYYNNPFAAPMD
jgi:hypothetical protein